MELVEPVDEINKLLKEYYGSDITGVAIWRVIYSEDQLEKRWTKYTDNGIELLQPEVRLVPKYKQWVHKKYLLERLTIINSFKENGMPAENVAYESIWVFEDKHGKALVPRYSVCKFVIDGLYAALGKESLVKYKDELINEPQEVKEDRLNQLQNELFGNETATGDALAYREGVVVPSNYSIKE